MFIFSIKKRIYQRTIIKFGVNVKIPYTLLLNKSRNNITTIQTKEKLCPIINEKYNKIKYLYSNKKYKFNNVTKCNRPISKGGYH